MSTRYTSVSTMPDAPRIVHKHTIDDAGNWVTKPFLVWRDETGLHDKPATIAVLKDLPTLIEGIFNPKEGPTA